MGGTWSPQLASGTGVFNPAVDKAGTYTYKVSGTTACPSDTATVTVDIVAGSDAGKDAIKTFCKNETPINLFSVLGGNPNLGGTWSPALTSGTGIFNPAVDNAGTYTYTITASLTCPSVSATVKVFIVTALDAGIDATKTVCKNEAPTNLFSILGGNPNLGGTWSPQLASGTGVFDPAVDKSGTYTYKVAGSSVCPTVSATVKVLVNELPSNTAALINLGAICLNSDANIIITNAKNLSNGNYQLTYSISGALNLTTTITVAFQNGNANFIIPSTIFNSVGTSTISIGPIQSNIGNSCGKSTHFFENKSFTIEQVNAPTFSGNNLFCNKDNATINNLTAGIVEPQTIIWYDAPINGNAYSNTTTLTDGTSYYAALISSFGCESKIRLKIMVTVKDCIDPALIIPDGFSPNGDGINDAFVIKNIRKLYPKFSILIYNRWGNVLFEGNSSNPDWEGTNEKGIKTGGDILPTGVYFYVLYFNDGVRNDIQGRLYLSK